jgi:N6-adenosine-specific RNA methylase IME4
MPLVAIRNLPVSDIADQSAHLYLWTTNRHLHEAFHVAEAWGFRHAQTLVWTKIPLGSFLGGAFGANVEFILFCRRGRLATKETSPSAWFDWPRVGAGSHSRKPDAFLDLVEQVSPGPYLELFARRNRFGWDTWGDEALEHVELAGRHGRETA